MAIAYLLSWWYTLGLKEQGMRAVRSVMSVFDYFSIDILFKTLFSPFRQISSGQVRGSLDVQLRAFVDRLISRLIGATVRSVTILAGLVTIIFAIIFQIVVMILWVALPFAPFVGLILMLGGWVPWSL